MKGMPKYRHKERVIFRCGFLPNTLKGEIYVVNAEGTKEQSEEPSYNIKVHTYGELGVERIIENIRESAIICKEEDVREKDRIWAGMIVRHYSRDFLSEEEKGTNKYRYRVLSTDARDTETGDRLVVYKALFPNEKGEYDTFTRSYAQFMKEVDHIIIPGTNQQYAFEEDREYEYGAKRYSFIDNLLDETGKEKG